MTLLVMAASAGEKVDLERVGMLWSLRDIFMYLIFFYLFFILIGEKVQSFSIKTFAITIHKKLFSFSTKIYFALIKLISYFEFFFFHSSFIQCYPLGSSYLVRKVLKCRYIEFFSFDYDSLPVSFQSGITFFL